MYGCDLLCKTNHSCSVMLAMLRLGDATGSVKSLPCRSYSKLMNSPRCLFKSRDTG